MTLKRIEQVKFDNDGVYASEPAVQGNFATYILGVIGSTIVSKTISQGSSPIFRTSWRDGNTLTSLRKVTLTTKISKVRIFGSGKTFYGVNKERKLKLRLGW